MTTYNTGNPLGSAAAKDLYDNAQNFDHLSNDKENESWNDRFGVPRLTWFGMENKYKQALSQMGWILVDSFQNGADITLPNQALHWSLPDGDGEYYRWDGALPKSVPANSTPESTGGVGTGAWIGVGDASLRAELSSNSGESLVSPYKVKVLPSGNLSQVFPYVTPEQFGAIGDGVTDDSVAIQAWLQHNGSGVSYLSAKPEKVYLVSDASLRVNKNTYVDLNGATIKGSVQITMYNGPTDGSDYASAYNGDGNIHFRNGTFEKCVFAFGHGANLSWEYITFSNIDETHFIEVNACKDWIINHCQFSEHRSTTDGTYIEDVQIDAAISSSGFGAFGEYDGTPSINGTITNNTHTGTFKAIGSHAFGNSQYSHIVVSGNTYDGLTFGAIDAFWWSDSNINNNSFKNMTGFSIRLHGATVNTRISGCSFSGSAQNHIIIQDYSTEKVKNVHMSMLDFYSVGFNHIRSRGGNGIFLSDITFETSPGSSLQSSDAGSNITLSNILIRESVSDPVNIVGALHFNSCTKVSISDVMCLTGNYTAITAFSNHTDTGLTYIDRVKGKIGTSGTNASISGDKAVIDGKCYIGGAFGNTDGTNVTVSADVRQFSHFIISSGNHSSGTHRSSVLMPDSKTSILSSQFGFNTAGGTGQVTFTSATTVSYSSTTDNINYLIGVM